LIRQHRMNKVRVILKHLFPVLILIGSASCIKELKEVKEIEWDITSEFGFPLAKANLSFSEVFKPGKDSSFYLYSDRQGILHAAIRQNVDTLIIDEMLSDFTHNKVLLDDSIELPKVTKGISIESPATYFRMNLDSFLVEQQIDSLLLNEGTIELEFKTWKNYDSKFSVILPNITDPNGRFVQFLNFKPSASLYKIALDLNESKLRINTSETSKGIFTIIMAYEIIGKSTGKNITPPIITMKMTHFDIKAAYGKMGKFEYDLDPIEISLFKSNPLGNQEIDLDLAEPKMDLLFLNQFGFPFRFDFSKLGVTNLSVFHEITGIQKSIYIEAPPLNNLNHFTQNRLSIDPSTNIDHLISKFPQKLIVEGKIIINPDNPNNYNYIREQDKLVMRVEADIPLRFSLTQININDTSSINLSNLQKLEDNLSLVKLQTKVKNQFPIDLKMQAYFTGSDYKIIDSLFKERVHIKSSGIEGVPMESLFLVDKTNSQIRNLKDCKLVIASASFGTSGSSSPIVDFSTSQSLDLEIVLFTRVNF
jgi:hypothetical protein